MTIGETMNGSDTGLKMLASFFAGIILTGIGAFLGYPHDLPTKQDVATLQQTTDKQLEIMQTQADIEKNEITALRVNVARIALKLNIPEVNP